MMTNINEVCVFLLVYHSLVISACTTNEYQCDDGVTCIPNSQLCDQSFDCPGNDDEVTTNCNPGGCSNTCPEGLVHCTDCSCASSLSACSSQVTTESTIGESSSPDGLTTGEIIGIIVGIFLAILIVVIVVVYLLYKRSRSRNRIAGSPETGTNANTTSEKPEPTKSAKSKLPPITAKSTTAPLKPEPLPPIDAN